MITGEEGVYAQITGLLVSSVPPDHPWFTRFAVVVAHMGHRGVTSYRLMLCQGYQMSDSVELPGYPLVPGSYGDLWKEEYTTEAEAVARAYAVAPHVLVEGYTGEQAMRMAFMSSEGVWAPE